MPRDKILECGEKVWLANGAGAIAISRKCSLTFAKRSIAIDCEQCVDGGVKCMDAETEDDGKGCSPIRCRELDLDPKEMN